MAREKDSQWEHWFRVPVLENALPILDRLARWHGSRRQVLEYAVRELLIKEHERSIKERKP